jgi:hypothetical protein
VIGCDYIVLVRADGLRRESLSRPTYYEAYAFFYLIDGRSGTLRSVDGESLEKGTQAEADEALFLALDKTVSRIARRISDTEKLPAPAWRHDSEIEDVPPEDSPKAVGLKPPIPYRRIKPEYTTQAFLYVVKGTVDIEAIIGADGHIASTRIVRWLGFGLDESVEKAVRTMNWRPAMRNGKPLPMRVLLRYNFTKPEKE